MKNYLIRRILQSVVVTLILSFVCYYLMSLMPGDPVDLMISSNPKITTQDVARLRELYGLDKPIYYRYFNWIKEVAAGDLGFSRNYKIPVTDVIGPRLLNTFILSMLALGMSLLIAIPLGIVAALKQGTRFDYAVNLFAFAAISVPSFWLAIILIIVFAVIFPLLPAGGTETIGGDPLSTWGYLVDRAKYLVLPTLSLAFLQIGTFVRFTRSSMIEAMRNDYVRTARSKGLSERVVIYKHALRNAILPLITIVALSISFVFSGAIITETIFAYQGVGKLVYDSIISNDFNVAMVSFMITVIMVLLMNLAADILYAVADPRIAYR